MIKHPSSFRDPSGFIFSKDGTLYRQVNALAREDYDLLMGSGLYNYPTSKGLLIPHQEVDNIHPDAYKTLRPERLGFISYPYEWSFAQYKDAARLTLRIQKIALKHGMSLKDASAYNIQFHRGKPIFIDTLSFESYKEGEAWPAYRQFCQHFLAPLSLAAYRDIRFLRAMTTYIDGIPLDLASGMLPRRTQLRFSLASHIHWHARAQSRHADRQKDTRSASRISKNGLLGIVSNLDRSIQRLKWNGGDTEWGDYYQNTNYSDAAFEVKHTLVKELLGRAGGSILWDLGANDGTFSSLGAELGMQTVAFDIDPIAVNKNYLRVRAKEEETAMLPILMDLTQPSPALGWANDERDSLEDRANADVVMALALIHHLAISNNLPLDRILEYFSRLAPKLIIEFVPKEDSKVQTLLATREDIFPNYNVDGFEHALIPYYTIVERREVLGSERILYLLERKS